MDSLSFRRISKELKTFEEDAKLYAYELEQVNDNDFQEFICVVPGPPDSLYEGGQYEFVLKMNDFPISPPSIKFITKIWHPNISHVDGTFCDIFGHDWSPAIKIFDLFLCIQVLLSTPNMDKPLDDDVAGQFNNDHDMFVRTARFWNQKYGQKVLRSGQYYDEFLEETVEEMSELGLREDRSIRALSEANWDVDQAVGLYHMQDEV